ncbi:SRPBCC family protein [Hoyosella rhizosphaerae]|uniref:Cyclase n=1 Tax=Hoyosella rhizosphaerae TaxID=1755582 RepID=A0A916X9Q8_9ACTN|nr:SRPBCC family protein [Hoyosella rhizosphaerae]MBN4926923.1 SRPBCC family protein [Hoyosella rhizosphaerae]GGC55450.1 cyclase [Hoyosella rhizosphaerae]
MGTVTQAIDVNVPVSVAYNQWTQFERYPLFMEHVEKIEQLDDTHLRWHVKFGPVSREFAAVIDEQHPDERVAWHSTEGPTHAGVITFHRLDEDTTRVTAQIDIDPEGIAEQVADALNIVDVQIKGDMKRFKEYIEDLGTSTGSWRGNVEPPKP